MIGVSHLIALAIIASSNMGSIKQDAESFAKKRTSSARENIGSFDISGLQPEGFVPFNEEKARHDLTEERYPDDPTGFVGNENVKKNRLRKTVDPDDFLFRRSENLTANADKNLKEVESVEPKYEVKTCLEPGLPFDVNFESELKVNVEAIPAKYVEIKICKGHEETVKASWKSEARKIESNKRREYSNNSSIKSVNVDIKGGGHKKYRVITKWTHIDNCPKCNHFVFEKRKITEERVIEKDSWSTPPQETVQLTESPQCTLIRLDCIDKEDRKIDGRTIKRPCWIKKYIYKCKYQKSTCDIYKSKQCLFQTRKCVKGTNDYCSIWENTYKCLRSLKKSKLRLNNEEIFGTDPEIYDTDYEPNTTSTEMVATLTLFDEIKKELESSEVFDATKVEYFRGKNMQCARNVAGDLIYDCCFSYKGLANDLKLSKCNADELALADMRDRGVCHYVGSYSEKMLDLWTSSKKHVFCCFPSKLSKVLHEQAREQLSLTWGEPKAPNCRGLNQGEIQRIDFSMLNLSEAIESPEIKNYSKKIEGMEVKLRDRIKKEGIL